MEKTAITSVCWLPRAAHPGHLRDLDAAGDEEEDEDLRQAHEALTSGGAASSSGAAAAAATGLEEFELDKYDDDEDNDNGMQFFSVLNADGPLAREKDPYMTGDPNSDSDEEGGDEIRPQDHVFLASSVEEDVCNLELYVFDEEEVQMYVHHDIMLSSYPLCVEWLNKIPGSDGNFAAIACIDHTIQIWDLESATPMEPVLALGDVAKPKKSAKKGAKKGKKKKAPSEGPERQAHDGPVLCVHGSGFNRNVLVSGSADQTVKVWDVAANSCVHTYTHHKDKVQCARWHPTEQAVLLSAAFDRKVGLLDVRQPGQVALVQLPAEAECAIWSRHRPFECLASCDNGSLTCFDVRKAVSKAAEGSKVWTCLAHDTACTSVTDAPAPNLLVTCGLDGQAKVWNTAGAGPAMVMGKNLQAGPLFTCQSSPDMPALVAFGGKCPVMWDLSSEQLLLDVFRLEGEGS